MGRAVKAMMAPKRHGDRATGEMNSNSQSQASGMGVRSTLSHASNGHSLPYAVAGGSSEKEESTRNLSEPCIPVAHIPVAPSAEYHS